MSFDDPNAQWLFAEEDLLDTPSVVSDGMSVQDEKAMRHSGVKTIYEVGHRLAKDFKLGQHVLFTAAIYFHRFYMRKSFKKFVRYEVAVTALVLAAKVEESSIRLEHIIHNAIKFFSKNENLKMDRNSKEHEKWANLVRHLEEILLDTICFDLTVLHPHEVVVDAGKQLRAPDKTLARAWALLTDALRHPISICYDRNVLAAAAFAKVCSVDEVSPDKLRAPPKRPFLGKRKRAIKEEEEKERNWLEVFECDRDEVEEAVEALERMEEELSTPHSAPATTPAPVHAAAVNASSPSAMAARSSPRLHPAVSTPGRISPGESVSRDAPTSTTRGLSSTTRATDASPPDETPSRPAAVAS